MDFASMFGGGGGSTPAGTTGTGGIGKGASGASSTIGNNSSFNTAASSPWVIMAAALAGLAVVGLVVWLILKKG